MLTCFFRSGVLMAVSTNGKAGVKDVVDCQKEDSKIRHVNKPFGTCATKRHMTKGYNNEKHCHTDTID